MQPGLSRQILRNAYKIGSTHELTYGIKCTVVAKKTNVVEWTLAVFDHKIARSPCSTDNFADPKECVSWSTMSKLATSERRKGLKMKENLFCLIGTLPSTARVSGALLKLKWKKAKKDVQRGLYKRTLGCTVKYSNKS
uniref:Uncharacterized protein n=1 Tax=Romanomermis culicivorax TaxID=13658 RepID=A0A915J6J0_ROMCU